ncbi:MAG: AraC family transcriptional regulator ligand-binding domain-containing protein [Marinobacter sp.]|uniref:AraC family transcriptional regulator ligand-binding domain-containing protein n=1 Tax=Marinobacter sp. TaxID=50741 RepID=UPI001B45D348|nr:AraC family transcriptional regulator ligand-binding domain-containing protein [Marinobacter sp.]MBQ0748156.1 AraC family transcriptional regulator ligand-binding domain-containing protein [Marinobacter sp.]MBQ0815977.1 AraC family transcriptional regulator ligand-binding domain-containing protein [Marinobacter sp.]
MTDFSRASSLALFNEYCLQTGLDSATMLKAAKLPADTLANPESLIPYSRFLNLLELCAENPETRCLPLSMACIRASLFFGPLLYLIQNARTVGESLQELTHYYHLHSSGAYVGFERQ